MKAALEELAAQGNETARVALVLAARVPTEAAVVPDSFAKHTGNMILDHVRLANENLAGAIKANDKEWTAKTDRCIEQARVNLMNISSMAGRLTSF